MFSLVLKNSILMILLIMIAHFMIINYICDMQRMHNKKQDIIHNNISTSLSEDPNVTAQYALASEVHALASDASPTEPPIQESLQDLYDFVYSEDKDDEIDRFFVDDTKPCDIPSVLTVPCDEQPKDTEIVFCKNEVDDFYEKNKKTVVRDDGRTETTIQGNPIVYEYREDGEDALQGFEGFSSGFMSIKN